MEDRAWDVKSPEAKLKMTQESTAYGRDTVRFVFQGDRREVDGVGGGGPEAVGPEEAGPGGERGSDGW